MKTWSLLTKSVGVCRFAAAALAGCVAEPESDEESGAAASALDGAIVVIGSCGVFGTDDYLQPQLLVCTVEDNINYPNEPNPPVFDLDCPPCTPGQKAVTCDVLDDDGVPFRRQRINCPSSASPQTRTVSAPPPHGPLPTDDNAWTVVPPTDPCAGNTGFDYTCCKKPWTPGCFDN